MTRPFLEILKDNKVLSQLCQIYYQNTGMVISFHYPGESGRIDFYPQKERSEYCTLIQSTPEGRQRCLACDREGLAAARKRGGCQIYKCHAGLVDVAIPIDHRGEEIGSLYTGQVILEEPGVKRLRQLHARLDLFGVTFPRFSEAFATVKVVDRKRLLFYVRLLDLMATYIIKTENEIHLHQAVVMRDRELHRRELEKIQLEKTLKDLSISVLGGGRKSRDTAGAAGSDGPPGRHLIEKARAFIEAHYGQDIMLEDVARAVFLSPNYFSSLFKKVAGCSFRSYLVGRRIQAARELLADTRLPIKEVVFQAGFRDYNYFNRTFRGLEGIPPARFRAAGSRKAGART